MQWLSHFNAGGYRKRLDKKDTRTEARAHRRLTILPSELLEPFQRCDCFHTWAGDLSKIVDVLVEVKTKLL